jgi:long-chain alkane monooxygenase
VFADPRKVHEVDHVGEFFRCRGRSFVFRSPQGRPVLWQAGSSDRGRDFAAKHAEAIFAVHPNVERMREYTDDLDQRLETKFGRAPGSVKRIYGVQTVVGLTRSEADEKYQRIRECIPLEGAVAWISGHFGPDFSKYDPNEIVQNIEIPRIQGLFDSIIYAKGGAPVTVREAALIYAEGMGMPRLVGTPADIAASLSSSSTRAALTASCWRRPIRPAASRNSSTSLFRSCRSAAGIETAIPGRPCERTSCNIEYSFKKITIPTLLELQSIA